MDCIFCKIAHGQLPSTKIYEDDTIICIMDINPATKGHSLLIPKKHHINIYDAPADVAMNVYPVLSKVANAIQKATGCVGMNIIQNNEAAAGQVVFHSHVHFIPRYEGDGLKIGFAGKKQADPVELAQIAAEIKKHI